MPPAFCGIIPAGRGAPELDLGVLGLFHDRIRNVIEQDNPSGEAPYRKINLCGGRLPLGDDHIGAIHIGAIQDRGRLIDLADDAGEVHIRTGQAPMHSNHLHVGGATGHKRLPPHPRVVSPPVDQQHGWGELPQRISVGPHARAAMGRRYRSSCPDHLGVLVTSGSRDDHRLGPRRRRGPPYPGFAARHP
jgi:hypothetical protein